MTRVVRIAAAVGVTLFLAGLIALGSSFPLPGDPPSDGLLRLDWRLRGEEAGGCLRPTAQELAELPPHMRNPDACVGGLPPYRLRVWVDGEIRLQDTIRAGGIRQDRPLTVYDEVSLTPGRRHVRIEFAPQDGPPTERRPSPSDEAGVRDRPTVLETEGVVEMDAGQVVLAVRRQDTGALVLRPPVRGEPSTRDRSGVRSSGTGLSFLHVPHMVHPHQPHSHQNHGGGLVCHPEGYGDRQNQGSHSQ